jgi:uncharacterized protein (DUF952 family)
MRPTYHLIPVVVWDMADADAPLARDSLDAEGFIHCTDGPAALIATAERHYRDDPRDFLALTVDLDVLTSPWRYDDPGTPYPHIYGPIDRAAIVEVTPVQRTADGRFLSLGGR